jgi:hypothetical protein
MRSRRAMPDRRRGRGARALGSGAGRFSQCSLQGRIKHAEKPGSVPLGQRSWSAGIRSALPEVPGYLATDECVAYICLRPLYATAHRAGHLKRTESLLTHRWSKPDSNPRSHFSDPSFLIEIPGSGEHECSISPRLSEVTIQEPLTRKLALLWWALPRGPAMVLHAITHRLFASRELRAAVWRCVDVILGLRAPVLRIRLNPLQRGMQHRYDCVK